MRSIGPKILLILSLIYAFGCSEVPQQVKFDLPVTSDYHMSKFENEVVSNRDYEEFFILQIADHTGATILKGGLINNIEIFYLSDFPSDTSIMHRENVILDCDCLHELYGDYFSGDVVQTDTLDNSLSFSHDEEYMLYTRKGENRSFTKAMGIWLHANLEQKNIKFMDDLSKCLSICRNS